MDYTVTNQPNMKKLFLLCLSALFLHSCSGSDDSVSDDTVPEIPETAVLVKTVLTNYNDDYPEKTSIIEYESGRRIKTNKYTDDNELESYVLFNYTPEGWEDSIITYNPDDTERNNITFFYDSQGRIYKVIQEGAYNVEVDYTFNDDNSVTGMISSLGSTKTFLLNEDGYPYKEMEEDGGFLEYTFDNFHMPISANETSVIGETTTTGNRTYQYDASHNPQLLNLADVHGNYKPNYTLKWLYIPEEDMTTANKYLNKRIRTWGNSTIITDYSYTFNNDGLPIKMELFHNDVHYSTTEYFYE